MSLKPRSNNTRAAEQGLILQPWSVLLPDRRHGGETVVAFLSNDEYKAFFFFSFFRLPVITNQNSTACQRARRGRRLRGRLHGDGFIGKRTFSGGGKKQKKRVYTKPNFKKIAIGNYRKRCGTYARPGVELIVYEEEE